MSQNAEKIPYAKTRNNYVFRDGRSKIDKIWLQDLALAVDIISQLSDLNLKLQGKNKLITQLYDEIKSFITNLSLWMSQSSNENYIIFLHAKS